MSLSPFSCCHFSPTTDLESTGVIHVIVSSNLVFDQAARVLMLIATVLNCEQFTCQNGVLYTLKEGFLIKGVTLVG
jgi:hypothetical protein